MEILHVPPRIAVAGASLALPVGVASDCLQVTCRTVITLFYQAAGADGTVSVTLDGGDSAKVFTIPGRFVRPRVVSYWILARVEDCAFMVCFTEGTARAPGAGAYQVRVVEPSPTVTMRGGEDGLPQAGGVLAAAQTATRLTLAPDTGPAGITVVASGVLSASGSWSEPVALFFGGRLVASGKTDGRGGFSIPFTVPSDGIGSYRVTAVGLASHSRAEGVFTMTT